MTEPTREATEARARMPREMAKVAAAVVVIAVVLVLIFWLAF